MTRDDFLAAAQLSDALVERWYAPLHAAFEEFEIATPARVSAFIAQAGHETLGFTLVRELWGPTTAQLAYEPPSRKAAELGNVRSGDGQRFRGRGLLQITGRANYAACGAALGVDLEGQPEQLEQAPAAARASAWWWHRHGCNALADIGDFVALTRRINGGVNGLSDRQRRWEIAKAAFGL
jgi:putative chitinase